jgi:hypothetical protein
MAEVVVYSRSDGSLFRVMPSTCAPEREAKRMSYGQPFSVQVAARVPGVNEAALQAALRDGEVGSGWYTTPLSTILEALVLASQREAPQAAEPLSKRREAKQAKDATESKRKRGEKQAKDATEPPKKKRCAEPSEEPEELGSWQKWLEPCRSSLAPRATEVKAILRERGAPSWLLPLCREVSQKDSQGHYRKILKLANQTVRASCAPSHAAPATE